MSIPVTNIATLEKVLKNINTLESKILRFNDMVNSESYIVRRIGFGESKESILNGLNKAIETFQNDKEFAIRFYKEHRNDCQSFSNLPIL